YKKNQLTEVKPMIFAKKEKEVNVLLQQHYDKVMECLQEFKKEIDDFLKNAGEHCHELSFATHLKEHEADEIRRKIQIKLNEGAFLPFYRGDFIQLADMVDKIANRAKNVAQELALECPNVPDNIKGHMRSLCDTVINCFKELEVVIDNILQNKKIVMDGAANVSKLEQEADSIEWKAKRLIFANKELDLSQKRQLKNFFTEISGVADQIENCADRCMLIITKQVV
ncbi:MAG: TIGR00153 family protein, partial [Candidatus Hydrogenedentota bacterium]